MSRLTAEREAELDKLIDGPTPKSMSICCAASVRQIGAGMRDEISALRADLARVTAELEVEKTDHVKTFDALDNCMKQRDALVETIDSVQNCAFMTCRQCNVLMVHAIAKVSR